MFIYSSHVLVDGRRAPPLISQCEPPWLLSSPLSHFHVRCNGKKRKRHKERSEGSKRSANTVCSLKQHHLSMWQRWIISPLFPYNLDGYMAKRILDLWMNFPFKSQHFAEWQHFLLILESYNNYVVLLMNLLNSLPALVVELWGVFIRKDLSPVSLSWGE